MDNKTGPHLRPSSIKRDRSEGKSSMEVMDSSSMRAQSTAPPPESSRASTEASSSFQQRHVQQRTMPCPPRYRATSIDDDLRGVESRVEQPHGVKRSRSQSSGDDDGSGDEPTPKRQLKDELSRELDDLEARTRGEKMVRVCEERNALERGGRQRREDGPSRTSPDVDLALKSRGDSESRPTNSEARSPRHSKVIEEQHVRGSPRSSASP